MINQNYVKGLIYGMGIERINNYGKTNCFYSYKCFSNFLVTL